MKQLSMFMKTAFKILFLGFILSASGFNLSAQNLSDKPFIAESDASGEETSVQIELIARDSKKSGERLFVIARRSKAETSDRISLSRLSYARTLLLEMRRFPFETAVFAVGGWVEGEGRMEFYLGSKLRLVTLAKRNKIPNLDCCPEYIPPVKRKSQRKKRI